MFMDRLLLGNPPQPAKTSLENYFLNCVNIQLQVHTLRARTTSPVLRVPFHYLTSFFPYLAPSPAAEEGSFFGCGEGGRAFLGRKCKESSKGLGAQTSFLWWGGRGITKKGQNERVLMSQVLKKNPLAAVAGVDTWQNSWGTILRPYQSATWQS